MRYADADYVGSLTFLFRTSAFTLCFLQSDPRGPLQRRVKHHDPDMKAGSIGAASTSN